MSNKSGKLHFGIMTYGMVLSAWQYKCISLLISSEVAEVVLIINDASVNKATNSFAVKVKNNINKHAFYRLSSKFVFKIPALKHIKVEDVLHGVDILNCNTIKKGKYSEYFRQVDIDEIKNKNLDFILRFGFNIIRGDILEVAKYGVWSFHHGNELKFRGGPTGFWEIYKNSPTNGVILQKLNNLIDAGVIINRRLYQTVLHSYSEHLNSLLMNSVDMPLQVCKQILIGDESSFEKEHSQSKAAMNKLPVNWKMMKFYFILFQNRIKFHITRLFKQEHWDIGIVQSVNSKLPVTADFKDVKWLNLRSGSQYAADCFCFNSNGSNYVVFEDYDYKIKKGVISLLKLDKNNVPIKIKTVIEKPFHLAYPFVFQYEHITYLIPETAENGTIELYEWDDKAEEFHFKKVLLDVAGVDVSIVDFHERWWLFCGIKNSSPNEKLFIYHSDELTGTYKAHTLNPVKTDPAGSRPAGQFIIKNDVLFRPAQHSVGWYGEKIDWFKISELTPTSFIEELVGEIAPQQTWSHNKGLHTFSKSSDIMVIDAKKRSSGWRAFLAELRFKK